MSKALYYFPHAGASAANFRDWHESMKPEILLISFDYNGHGRLKDKAFYRSVKEAVNDIYNRMKNDVPKREKYFLGGQCLGAVIAYELYYKIKAEGELKLPDKLILIGQGAPDIIKGIPYSTMEFDEIIQVLYQEGNIDQKLLSEEYKEAVNALVVRPLKADSEIYESYKTDPGNEYLNVETHIFYGEQDMHYTVDDIKRWDSYVNGDVHYHSYTGGHNIIKEHLSEILCDIKEICKE